MLIDSEVFKALHSENIHMDLIYVAWILEALSDTHLRVERLAYETQYNHLHCNKTVVQNRSFSSKVSARILIVLSYI